MARKSVRAVPVKAKDGRRSKSTGVRAPAKAQRAAPRSKKAPARKRAPQRSRASLEAVRDNELRRMGSSEQRMPDEPMRRDPPPKRPSDGEQRRPSLEAEVGGGISSGIAGSGSRETTPTMPGLALPQMQFPSLPNMPLPNPLLGMSMPSNPTALQQLGTVNFEAALFMARRSIAVTEGLLQLMRCRTMPEVWRVQMTLVLDALLDFQKLTMRLVKPPSDG